MFVLLSFFLIAFLFPVVILLWRKTFKTAACIFLPPAVYFMVQWHLDCLANSYSEACTWGYFNLGLALFFCGCAYILVTIIQLGGDYLNKRKMDR